MYRVKLYDSYDELMTFEFAFYTLAAEFIASVLQNATRHVTVFIEGIEEDETFDSDTK